jgi:hypothetical protein
VKGFGKLSKLKKENIMHFYDYEYEKCNKDVFDDLREYCSCERVDEKHLRTLIEKPNHIKNITIALMRSLRNLKKAQSFGKLKSKKRRSCTTRL